MVEKQIIPYGVDLNKKPKEALALSVMPPREIAPVPPRINHDQSYYAQVVHHPMIAPPPPCLLLKDKTRQPEPLFSQLDAPKPIKLPEELNLLAPRPNKTLTKVQTNMKGDVTCANYKSVMQRVTIDGVGATPDQIKVVSPKRQAEKKKGCHHFCKK